jgi:hypothetical protein
MKKVLCLDDGREFFFIATSGYDAIQKMLYYLNLSHQDNNAKIELCNGRTWSVVHNGKTYGCLI